MVEVSGLEPCDLNISWMKLSGHISGPYKYGFFAYFSFMCRSGSWPALLGKKDFSKCTWAFRGQRAQPNLNNLAMSTGPKPRMRRNGLVGSRPRAAGRVKVLFCLDNPAENDICTLQLLSGRMRSESWRRL